MIGRGRIVILEGPDCAGKSTLLEHLNDHVMFQDDTFNVHFGNYPNIKKSYPRMYLEGMMPALLGHRNVIMDRCWLSEEPYAFAYRHGDLRFDDADCRMLERVALSCSAAVIHCDPGFDHIAKTFESRKGEEYLDSVDQVKDVWMRYPARMKKSHLQVMKYDFHKQDVHDVVRWLQRDVMMLGGDDFGIGGLDPQFLLVGDTFANHSEWDMHQQFPFVSFGPGCSRWLACELDKAHIPEQDLWWVNQDMLLDDGTCASEDTIEFIKSFDQDRIFALGDVASDKLRQIGVIHRTHHHPSYWKRFMTTNGEYPLISSFKEFYRE